MKKVITKFIKDTTIDKLTQHAVFNLPDHVTAYRTHSEYCCLCLFGIFLGL